MWPSACIALATALRHCVDGFKSEVYHIPRSFSSEHLDSCTLSLVVGSRFSRSFSIATGNYPLFNKFSFILFLKIEDL